MTNNSNDILNEKFSDPAARMQLESIIGNLSTVADSLQWLKTLQDTGMSDSLKGLAYLLANLRSILTEDMLNGVASMLNSILEVLSKISDPQVVEGLVSLLDGISSGKLSQEPKIHGTFSLLGELKDPEVEAGLAVAINMLKGLGKIGKH
jgi:uncharacterized protein YjgD (DUF1641 family)